MKKIFKIISLSLLICALPNVKCTATDLEYGPYAVGFEAYKTHDDSRTYLLGEDSISRPLLIHFWYPSEEKTGAFPLTFKHYMDLISLREDYHKASTEIEENSLNYVSAYSEFAKKHLSLNKNIHARDILDSPVHAKGGIPRPGRDAAFPLLIYAPSNSKSSVQNHVICEYLASHGFMILSVASAGPNSVERASIPESTMAQVIDMEYILRYFADSLNLNYTKLGLFGFSSGGNAIALFQMRNQNVDAVFSMDGGQEYGAYAAIHKMADFNLKKAVAPYCSVVNNYENFSIYPYYSSVPTTEKLLIQMPYLDHNGFISHWRFFESCSTRPTKSPISESYDLICKCALEFLNKFLKPLPSRNEYSFMTGLDEEFIRPVLQNYSASAKLCNALLNNDLEAASSLIKEYKTELFTDESQINILARMFVDSHVDQAIWLYLSLLENHPDSWQAHYHLGSLYKKKGATLRAKNALLKAQALNPDNVDITNLLKELDETE